MCVAAARRACFQSGKNGCYFGADIRTARNNDLETCTLYAPSVSKSDGQSNNAICHSRLCGLHNRDTSLKLSNFHRRVKIVFNRYHREASNEIIFSKR